MKANATIRFGKWLPDLADLDNPGLTEAKNCLPVKQSYTEFPGLVGSGDALPSDVRGATVVYDIGNNPAIFAGTTTNLYQRLGTGWDSRGSGYAGSERTRWKFASYGGFVFATNYADPLQYATVGGAFQPISGLRARVIGVVGQFVMVGDTADNASELPYAVRWCAIGNPTDWPIPLTLDATSKSASREKLRSEHGPVTFISGGERTALVFQQRGITRFVYIGGNQVFQVDNFEESRGAETIGGNVRIENNVYFYSRQGFHVTNGVSVQDIGQDVIDDYVRADFDQNYPERMEAAVDYLKTCIHWSYPGTGNVDGEPNKVVSYNWKSNRWTHSDMAIEFIFSGISQAVSLDDLDDYFNTLEEVTPDLDSPVWQGGALMLSGFTGGQLGTFTGVPLVATIDTTEVNLNEGGRSFVSGITPIVEGSGSVISASIGYRNSQQDPVYFNDLRQINPRTRQSDHRIDAVYHRARVQIANGFTRAIGVQFQAKSTGSV